MVIFIIIFSFSVFVTNFILEENSKPTISNKIGFGISTKAEPEFWAKKLNASWFLDWKTTSIKAGIDPEYWQMIRLSQNEIRPSKNEIIRLVMTYPGHTWIIGNEPDNIWQDNIEFTQFTQYYHDLYYLIKFYDPTSQIAIGAISQPSPLRLKYLDFVLAEYQERYNQKLPVDWWTIHAYVLREEKDSWGADIPPGFSVTSGTMYEIQDHGDVSIFIKNIMEFRTWMKNNGYQNKPLAITEFGILLPEEFGFQPERVAKYLAETFDWLLTSRDEEMGYPGDDFHFVQKFAWFSLGDVIFPVADLVDFSKMKPTIIGEQFIKSSITIMK